MGDVLHPRLPSLPPSLSFVARLASAAGGTRVSAMLWTAHALAVAFILVGGRPFSSWAFRVLETFAALQPLVLTASSRSMALAIRALPRLHARVARGGGDADALFSALLPPRCLPFLVSWAQAVLLWVPAGVSTIVALAMLADPSLREARDGGALAREALALALAVRALGAPLLVLLALARLLRFSVCEFWGRVLPGAAEARAGVWLLSSLHAGAGGGGGGGDGEPLPLLSPDAARRELFGKGDAGGLLHDAKAADNAVAPAATALAAASAALVIMNFAAAVAAPTSSDAVDHVAHALLLVAGGFGGVGMVLLLANAWLDPLRRWLRRAPPLDLLLAARGASGWAGDGGGGGAPAAGGALALEWKAAALHEAYWTLLNREGRLLQLAFLGVPVDQKTMVRAGSAWVFGGALSLMWSSLPRAVQQISR